MTGNNPEKGLPDPELDAIIDKEIRDMTTRDLAIKIAEEEIGNDICNQVGLKATLKILGAIERAIEIGETEGSVMAQHPVRSMKMNLKSL